MVNVRFDLVLALAAVLFVIGLAGKRPGTQTLQCLGQLGVHQGDLLAVVEFSRVEARGFSGGVNVFGKQPPCAQEGEFGNGRNHF